MCLRIFELFHLKNIYVIGENLFTVQVENRNRSEMDGSGFKCKLNDEQISMLREN